MVIENYWRDVIVIDPRGIIGDGDLDTVARQRFYSETLKSKQNSPRYIVIGTKSKTPRELFEDFYAISKPRRFSILFVLRASRTIKQLKIKNAVFTCADPWESLLSLKIIKFLSGIEGQVHVQIHADITDPNWRRFNVVNLLRYYIALLTLRSASVIRVVSQVQKKRLQQIKYLKNKSIFVAPIPINSWIEKNRLIQRRTNKNIIGFVGRIHPDRGLDAFCKLIATVNLQNQSFSVRVIGSGPMEEQFRENLLKIVGKDRLEFTGHLEAENYSKVFCEISVLGSFAPSESYGRAIREALICGIPVLAAPSIAVTELSVDISSKALQVISNTDNQENVYRKYLDAMNAQGFELVGSKLLEENSNTIEAIINTWGLYVTK